MTFLQQMCSIQERALKAIVIFVIIFLVCNPSSLGLSNHELSDLNFNASSSFSPFAPRDARLYANTSWANEGYSSEEFLQISFHPYSKLITGVATHAGKPSSRLVDLSLLSPVQPWWFFVVVLRGCIISRITKGEIAWYVCILDTRQQFMHIIFLRL